MLVVQFLIANGAQVVFSSGNGLVCECSLYFLKTPALLHHALSRRVAGDVSRKIDVDPAASAISLSSSGFPDGGVETGVSTEVPFKPVALYEKKPLIILLAEPQES